MFSDGILKVTKGNAHNRAFLSEHITISNGIRDLNLPFSDVKEAFGDFCTNLLVYLVDFDTARGNIQFEVIIRTSSLVVLRQLEDVNTLLGHHGPRVNLSGKFLPGSTNYGTGGRQFDSHLSRSESTQVQLGRPDFQGTSSFLQLGHDAPNFSGGEGILEDRNGA